MTINISNKLVFLLAGAAAGMLFAPKSGQEMRSTISGKIDDLRNKVQERVQAGDVVERGKNVANIGRQRLNESLESFDRGDRDIAPRR